MTLKLLLSTVVWGEDYLEIFLEQTLKSLLTKENLLYKEISTKSEYLIFTEKKYIPIIKKHTNFKKINKKFKIKFKILKINKVSEKYSTLKKYQNKSIQYGYNNKFDFFSFIYPDSVFGQNHFRSLIKKIKKGYKIILCPGPLGIYEKFIDSFKKKKINNSNLSNFILNNLHPFYSIYLKNNPKNRLKIIENKKEKYQVYQCFDLHVALISLSIKNLSVEKSYDEDLLNNSNVFVKDIDYLNHSGEGIIITLESYFSERSIISTTENYKFPKYSEIKKSMYDAVKFCDNKFKTFHINNYYKGIYIVSKNYINYENLQLQSVTNKLLKEIMNKNNFKVINKKSILEQFFDFKLKNKKIKIFDLKTWNYNTKEIDEVVSLVYKEIKHTNTIKLAFIGSLIIIYLSLPILIKNYVDIIRKKAKSNFFRKNNEFLIRFLINIPRHILIKILFKRLRFI